jgi:hypothetical protein
MVIAAGAALAESANGGADHVIVATTASAIVIEVSGDDVAVPGRTEPAGSVLATVSARQHGAAGEHVVRRSI